MNASEARVHYPLYTRYQSRKGGDYILINRHCDPVTEVATSMYVIDINTQEPELFEFDHWHEAFKSGKLWRVEPKQPLPK